jgi:hypothetical protein
VQFAGEEGLPARTGGVLAELDDDHLGAEHLDHAPGVAGLGAR